MQKLPPIPTDLDRQIFPVTVRLGQSILLKAGPVQLIPPVRDPSLQPVRGNPGQAIQGMPHHLAHAFQAVQVSDRCLNMRRVGSLFASFFQQTPGPELFQQIIQQALFLTARYQPTPKLAQHRKIEPWVLQFQAQ